MYMLMSTNVNDDVSKDLPFITVLLNNDPQLPHKDPGVRETGIEHNTTLHNTAAKRTAQRIIKKFNIRSLSYFHM